MVIHLHCDDFSDSWLNYISVIVEYFRKNGVKVYIILKLQRVEFSRI